MTHGPVMFSIEGVNLASEYKEMLQHPAAGGVILFARNYESPAQVQALIEEIHQIRSPALLVAVDQEGGRVQRFQEGLTRLPAASGYEAIYNTSPKKAKAIARNAGWLMAAELRTLGIDFSFAPVLDVDVGCSTVIGDRSFGNRPDVVAELGASWVLGAREAGMVSVGKHFPGHGGVEADSHLELPVDRRSLETIEMEDLYPFRRLIENGLEGIMPAHVVYSEVDAEPAGFSRFWITTILRERYRFPGVVFSDDLSMAAAEMAGAYADRAALALDAGCDMVLVCNNDQATGETLDSLIDYADPVAQSRLARMHGKKKYDWITLKENKKWHDTVAELAAIQADPELTLNLS